jgi:hypothetical protein
MRNYSLLCTGIRQSVVDCYIMRERSTYGPLLLKGVRAERGFRRSNRLLERFAFSRWQWRLSLLANIHRCRT